MTTDKPCPTCNHLHPRGIGAAICGCPDCFLLWTTIPFDLLSPQSQVRLKGLIAMQEDDE